MIGDIVIEPMTEQFLLWRCLHHGPLSRDTIEQWPSSDKVPWERCRKRNYPLLAKLTRTYGACAIVARDGEQVVGSLRFYPKTVCGIADAGGLCLQQDFPAGPALNFADADFPPLSQIADRTLVVHCLMTGSTLRKENPYQREGIGARLVKTLIEWARTSSYKRSKSRQKPLAFPREGPKICLSCVWIWYNLQKERFGSDPRATVRLLRFRMIRGENHAKRITAQSVVCREFVPDPGRLHGGECNHLLQGGDDQR